MSEIISGSVFIVGPNGELVLSKNAVAVTVARDSQTTNERVMRWMQEEAMAQQDARGRRALNDSTDTRGKR